MLKGGLLVAITLLGVKSGLVLGFSGIGRRMMVLISTLLGLGLVALAVAFQEARPLLAQLLDRYTFPGAILMAGLFMYLGLQEPPGWRESPAPGEGGGLLESTGTRAPGPGPGTVCQAGFLRRKLYRLSFLPCPFCMAALALSVILSAPVLGVSTLVLGAGTAVLFAGLVLLVGLGVRALMKRIPVLTSRNPAAMFNDLLLVIGGLTLLLAFTVPNITAAMTLQLGGNGAMPIPGSEYLGRIMHVVSQSLLIPVVLGLLVVLALSLFELGGLLAEVRRGRWNRPIPLEQALAGWAGGTWHGGLDPLAFPPAQRAILRELSDFSHLPVTARKILARRILEREEGKARKTLEKTDLVIRLGPALGLMGTLIPLGPGLAALGQGNLESLAAAVIIAFDTTVVGLAAGGISYVVSRLRRRWYEERLAYLEALLEALMEVKGDVAAEEAVAVSRTG